MGGGRSGRPARRAAEPVSGPTDAEARLGRPRARARDGAHGAADVGEGADGAPADRPLGNGPTSLLITRTVAKQGRRWAEVLLPVRPNGVRGWVPFDVLRIHSTPLRIVIDVSERRLTLFRSNRPLIRAPIAVGSRARRRRAATTSRSPS